MKTFFVVIDMPFMSYQTSVYDAVVNAGRLIKETGGNAVKLEGGAAVTEQIKSYNGRRYTCSCAYRYDASVGQCFRRFQSAGARAKIRRVQILQDAFDVQEAGAFAVVLECVPAKLAALISEKLTIPTIGIGAGEGCDGQVLVWQDMLGLFSDYVPKFVKHFAGVGDIMVKAFEDYDREVKSGVFPAEEHCFKIDDEIIDKLREDK